MKEKNIHPDIPFYSKFIDFDISALSQIITIKHKSCIMNINCNEEKGVLIFREGEVIEARYRGLTGFEAARKLVKLRGCEAEILPDNRERKITDKFSVSNLLNDTASAQEELKKDDTDVNGMLRKDKAVIWEKYLKKAATIPGFVWGCFVNMKGEILKISSFNYASEAFAYACTMEDIQDAREDCLANIDIGLPATVQIRTKKGIAFYTKCKAENEFFLTFFALDVHVEMIPTSIYQILKDES